MCWKEGKTCVESAEKEEGLNRSDGDFAKKAERKRKRKMGIGFGVVFEKGRERYKRARIGTIGVIRGRDSK